MSGAEHVIVIGGGLDGLTAACKLARSGRRVTVVERSQQLGGRAAPLELESGQSVPAILQQHAHLPFKLVSDLGLDRFGLESGEHRPLADHVSRCADFHTHGIVLQGSTATSSPSPGCS